MFEQNGMVLGGVGSSKAKDENAGFITPRNKDILSRKAIFTDKPKMAFGDLKRGLVNVATPSKGGTIEKTGQATPFKPFTPNSESNIAIKVQSKISTSKPPAKIQREVIDYSKSEMEVWNQKLLQMLSDEQFDKIFVNPPDEVPPLEPVLYCPPEPILYCSPPPEDCSELGWLSKSYDDDEYDLPAVNNSFDLSDNFY